MQIAIYVMYECVLHSKVKTLSQQIHLCRSTFCCCAFFCAGSFVCLFVRLFRCCCYLLNIELERMKRRDRCVGFMHIKKSNAKIVFSFSFSRFFGMKFFCVDVKSLMLLLLLFYLMEFTK